MASAVAYTLEFNPSLNVLGVATSALASPQVEEKAKPLPKCIFCEQRVSDVIQIISFSPSPERYAHQFCANKHSGQLKKKQSVPRPDIDKIYLTTFTLFIRPSLDAFSITRHSTHQWSILIPREALREKIEELLGTPIDSIVKVTHYWRCSKLFVLSHDNNTLNQTAVERGIGRSPADLVPDFERELPDEIGIEVMKKGNANCKRE